jgi:rubrerythrin
MEQRTSREWWEHTLAHEGALIEWLRKQYHGEATAAVRVRNFAEDYCGTLADLRTLGIIAGQEDKHAEWIAGLLRSRGMEPKVLTKIERYWGKTLPGIDSFETGAAIAAHAEGMRLERIRVIATHPKTPEDIRAVFERILPEETFHEKAFREMAGVEALQATLANHERGMESLGLVA